MKLLNRKFSKLLACALVFLFALTAAVPAFAAAPEKGPGNLKVTIRNNEGLPAMTKTQFTVYQIFSGKAYKDENTAVGKNEWEAFSWNNYTLADIEWGSSISDSGTALLGALKALQKGTAAWAFAGEGTNVFASVSTAAELAKVLADHTDNHFMQNFAKTVLQSGGLKKVDVTPDVSTGKLPDDASDDSLTFTLPDPGYYLFDETDNNDAAVSEYMLAVVGEQDILLKASIPTVDKDIIEGITDKKGEAAGVGDYVQFKLTGTLPKNYDDFDNYKYIFHDTLSKGLTYVQNDETHPLTVRVYKDQDTADKDVTHVGGFKIEQTGNYNVSTAGSEEADPKCNLEVRFDDLKKLEVTPDEITSASVFVVTYYAQINKDAVLLSEGNPNTVLLEYSNNPNSDGTGRTKEKTVYVYAFGLDLTKVGSDDNKRLEGAGFVLKNADKTKYATFEDQWVLTAKDNSSQTFYATQEQADAANTKGTGTVEGPVRRLTGWTDAGGTETVKNAITAYQNAKKDFDKAPSEQQASPSGTAYQKLQTAKKALEGYLLESGADGAIPDVYGLDAGSYNLEEVIVPDGYNSLEKDFDISITANINEDGKLQSVQYKHGEETVTYKNDYSDGVGVPAGDTANNMMAHFKAGLVQDEIVNQKAPFLPFTGGIGTIIFYVLGLTLIGGAVTYLVIASKKRKNSEENA